MIMLLCSFSKSCQTDRCIEAVPAGTCHHELRGTLLSCALLRLSKRLLELLTFHGIRQNLSCTSALNAKILPLKVECRSPASSISASFRYAREDVVATDCSRAPLPIAKPGSLSVEAKFLSSSCRL